MCGEVVRTVCMLSVCLAACGEADAGNPPASHSDSGTGGLGSGGGSSGGAGGQAAGSGGASGSAAATGAHCSPGTFLEDPVNTYATGNVKVCYQYPASTGGIPVSDTPGIRSVKLPGPMNVGQEYSMSVEILGAGAPNAEIWGSASECGFGDELLWSGSMAKGIFCVTLHPTKASTHLLVVWRKGGGQHASIMLCPGVACPK